MTAPTIGPTLLLLLEGDETLASELVAEAEADDFEVVLVGELVLLLVVVTTVSGSDL